MDNHATVDAKASTQRVVLKPLKIDLHIHSAASRHKDKALVSDGTIENLDVLVGALNRHGVNLAAITDHDYFDYNLFDTLRKRVDGSTSLAKVLPGIEFSVMFSYDGEQKMVHVVTIFDDSDEDALKNIQSKIPWKGDAPDYNAGHGFSEAKYWEIIRSIGLDVVVIAHQKNTLSSDKPRSKDANSLGREAFNEFLFLDYFEAYEYKNQRNELFNKIWTVQHEQADRLRFITGSDCHQWAAYPDYKLGKHEEFKHTYLKCLPTFRGLAMAITDYGRINTVGSFFSRSSDVVQSIDLTIKGEDVSIPLSPGINAIIGDNSVGKSCLINAITGYRSASKQASSGYKKYLEKRRVEVRTIIPDSQVAVMDDQGSIRRTLEDLGGSKTRAQNKLKEHFVENSNVAGVLQYAKNQVDLYVSAVEASCAYNEHVAALSAPSLPDPESLETPHNLTILSNLRKSDVEDQNSLVGEFRRVDTELETIINKYPSIIMAEDKSDLTVARKALGRIVGRHQVVVARMELENKVINAVNSKAQDLTKKIRSTSTDAQKVLSAHLELRESLAEDVVKAVKLEQKTCDFEFSTDERDVEPRVNPVAEYKFVTRAKTKSVTQSYLIGLVDRVLRSNKSIDLSSVTHADVQDAIARYPVDDNEGPIEVLRSKLYAELDKDFAKDYAILREGDDVYSKLSEGFNARIYFSLMADEQLGRGIYIVDQPEDQISQQSIRSSVLCDFRDIAQVRQVLLITHNPQFIVNLDVDNVIYLEKNEDSLSIRSGALEYEGEGYRILDIVADNIEGGLDTIRKRMKRYEKAD